MVNMAMSCQVCIYVIISSTCVAMHIYLQDYQYLDASMEIGTYLSSLIGGIIRTECPWYSSNLLSLQRVSTLLVYSTKTDTKKRKTAFNILKVRE